MSQSNVLHYKSENLFHPASPGGSGGQEKGKKKQNCVPVMVSEVLAAPEEGFTVEGMEVGGGE